MVNFFFGDPGVPSVRGLWHTRTGSARVVTWLAISRERSDKTGRSFRSSEPRNFFESGSIHSIMYTTEPRITSLHVPELKPERLRVHELRLLCLYLQSAAAVAGRFSYQHLRAQNVRSAVASFVSRWRVYGGPT